MPYVNDPSSRKAAQDYFSGGTRGPEAPSAPSVEQRLNELPNAEKLTPFERTIYKALPGFSESSFGKALVRFGDSWAGKALGYLDVLAEGLERSIGLGVQLANRKDDEMFSLRDGWYAGSMFYDVANLPGLKYDGDRVVGISIPGDDLPGTEDLAVFRARFAALVAQGVPEGEALIQVKDEYYNGVGALALRGQLQDTFFHVVADPLNLVAAAVKPAQALKAKAFSALTQKSALSLGALSDLEKELKAVNKLSEAAEVAKLSAKIANGEIKTLNALDKAAIWIARADDFGKPRGRLLEWITKPFQLSPESKSKELVSLIHDNISARVIAKYINASDGPEQIAAAITRMAKGSVGNEFGYIGSSLMGRTVQGFLGGADTASTKLLADWRSAEVSALRGSLKTISAQLGQDEYKVLEQIAKNPAAILKQLSPDAIQALGLSDDALSVMAEVFKGKPWLHDVQAWSIKVLADIEDHAMRQAIVQFGVKERGILTRWSQAIKSMESLAFLRLNPAYGIRNFVNNEVTLISRGLFGMFSTKEVDDFWKIAGFSPSRLGEGFANVAEAERESVKLLQDAIMPKRGAPEKISDFVHGIAQGKYDVTSLSAGLEKYASRRAVTIGYKQWFQQYWKPTSIANRLADADMQAIEKLSPGLGQYIDDLVRSSRGNDALIDAGLKTNINLTPEAIFREVERVYGKNAAEELGEEIVSYIDDGLPKAVQNNKVDEFFAELAAKLDTHNDEVFDARLKDFVGDMAQRIEAEGQPGMSRALVDLVDSHWGGHIEHAIRMPEAVDSARQLGGPGWENLFLSDSKHFDKVFRRGDAVMQAIDKATNGKVPPAVRRVFTELKGNWDDFYTFRTEGFAKLKGLKDQEWTQAYVRLQDELNVKYLESIQRETAALQKMDDAVAALIPDANQQKMFLNFRDHINQLRQATHEAVVEQRKVVMGLDPQDRSKSWADFWAKQHDRYVEIWQNERAQIGAMQGDPVAVQYAESLAPAARTVTEGEFDIFALADEFNIPGSGTQRQAKYVRDILKKQGVELDLSPPSPVKSVAEVTPAEAAKIPRSELPPALSEKIAAEADSMLNELYQGEAGMKIFKEPLYGGSPEVERFGTTNAKWYGWFNQRYGAGKKQVDAALTRIVADKGKDKGVNVERLKSMIIDRLVRGSPETGAPPDLYAMRLVGASDDELLEALDDFNRIANTKFSLADALVESGSPVEEAFGVTQKAAVKPGVYTALEDVPEDVARQAFEAYAATGKKRVPPQTAAADLDSLYPKQMPLDLGMSELTYRQKGVLQTVREAALTQSKKNPVVLDKLPPNLKEKVLAHLEQVKIENGEARYQASRWGMFRRDAALLNYNRRTNADTFVSNIFPFAFWTTNSIQKWAIESIDRPAMLTSYLRMRKLLETSGISDPNRPSRLQRKIRVKLPFLPAWMGDQFIDPLRLALPIDAFAQPVEQAMQANTQIEGRATRLLQNRLENGEISQADYDNAVQNQDELWKNAVAETLANDESQKFDAWDFASVISSPHAPIQWAKSVLEGKPEEIGPFSPLSRIARNVATAMGVEDYANAPWNLEAKFRRSLGLPIFDKWDDYRIDRALAGLHAEGKYDGDDIQRALAISAEIQRGIPRESLMSDPAWAVYQEGVSRANQIYTGGAAGTILGLLGMPVNTYPWGEQAQRSLKQEFNKAYAAKDAGDDDALEAFFDKHPEYASYLAIFKDPEEKLRIFLVDQAWSQYYALPTVTRKELIDQLGPDFEMSFVNKETRNPNMPIADLQVYLKLMGGNPVGYMSADQNMLIKLFSGQLELTKPETAWRVQSFYDGRKRQFPDYYEKQNAYYDLPAGSQRKAYLAKNPDLKTYWDWRREFMTKNPDLAPYLEDDPKKLEKYQNLSRRPEYAVPTVQEFNISPSMQNLINEARQGTPLPAAAERQLEIMAQQYGMSIEQIHGMLGIP